MSKFDRLKALLRDNDMHFEEDCASDGSPYVLFRQSMENAGILTILIALQNEELNKVVVRIYNIAKISSPLKRDELLRIINKLNKDYDYFKFFAEDNGAVSAGYDAKIDSNYDFEDLLRLVATACKVVIEEDAVKQFMKLQWA